LAVKLEYLRGENRVPHIPDLARIEAELPDPEGTAFFLDLAARSVTILKGRGDVFPLDPEKTGKVLLAGQYGDFFSAGKRAFPGAVSYWYSGGSPAEFQRFAREADTIIFCISDASGLSLLRRLRGQGKRVIVFSVLNPVYLEELDWTDGALAVYSYAPESFIAGFSALRGRFSAEGKFPFPVKAAPSD
jgi:beta-N-acetylhexosaminidase